MFCPVTLADMRAAMRGLPADSCRGVRSVRVCEWIPHHARYIRLGNLDFKHRFGAMREWFQDWIYIPRVGGCFNIQSGRIDLHYFGGSGGWRPTPVERATVKGIFLETLIHEIAHAYDRAHRVLRGRWRMDDGNHREAYAEMMAATWCRVALWPYLRQRVRRAGRTG